MTTETTNARPTHRIFAVTKNGKKKFWQPIGDYLPLNGAEIVIREIGDDTQG